MKESFCVYPLVILFNPFSTASWRRPEVYFALVLMYTSWNLGSSNNSRINRDSVYLWCPRRNSVYFMLKKKLYLMGFLQSCKKPAGMQVPPVRKVSTFNQQINAKSAGTGNKKPILNDIIYVFCNLKALTRIILRKVWKLEILHGGRLNTFCNLVFWLLKLPVLTSLSHFCSFKQKNLICIALTLKKYTAFPVRNVLNITNIKILKINTKYHKQYRVPNGCMCIISAWGRLFESCLA